MIEVEELWAETKLGRTRAAIEDRKSGNSITTVELVRVATKRVEVERVTIEVPVKAKVERSH